MKLKSLSTCGIKNNSPRELDRSINEDPLVSPERYLMHPRFMMKPRSGSCSSTGKSIKPIFHYLDQKKPDTCENLQILESCTSFQQKIDSKSSLNIQLIPEYEFKMMKEPWYSLTLPAQDLPKTSEGKIKSPIKKKTIIIKPYQISNEKHQSLRSLLNDHDDDFAVMKLSRFQRLETESRDSKATQNTQQTQIEKKILKSSFSQKIRFRASPQRNKSREVKFATKVVLLTFNKNKDQQ